MYRVVYRKSAAKALTRMPKPLAMKYLMAFKKMATDPETEGLDIKSLSGRGGYRLRIGQYRAIYHIEANSMVIDVLTIGPRGDIYK